MVERRFPFERSTWERNPETKQRWFEAMESIGPENVRVVLAFDVHGSGAAVGIGTEIVTKGFAQEWLAWHDRQKLQLEADFREDQVYWTRWAAIAASAAAGASVIGWSMHLMLQTSP
jgi:hypothetical protein